MGKRNEPRGRRWARRLFVGTLVAVVVQALGWLLLDGVAEAVVVWVPWALVTAGMALTVPVGRPGLPTPPPSLAQAFAPAVPTLTYVVPSSWLGTLGDDFHFAWFLAALGVGAVVVGVALWRRVRRFRRAPVPLVALRRTDGAP